MKRQCILSALLLLLSALPAVSQESTLREFLQEGLQNNYSLKIVRNEEQIAANNNTLANAGALPTVDLSAGYAGSLATTETTSRADGSTATDRNALDHTLTAGITADWTLFDGFKIQTERSRLRELQRQGETLTRIAIEDYIANLASEYFNLVQQEIRFKNLLYAVKLSKERLRIAEERYIIGSNSRLDYRQAGVDFNADSADCLKQIEVLATSRIRINELLANEDLDRRFQVRDTVITIDEALQWDVLSYETRTANAELLIADRDNTISELDLQSIRSRNYPYLNLTAGYGYTHNRYGSGTSRLRSELGMNAGLQLGFTIFDGNRRREQRNARIQIENTRLTRQQLEQTLLADLSNFWQAYQNNLEVIRLERENLIAARENYLIAMDSYRLGSLSGIEVREAQKSLLDAEERILQAQYNTKLCEISLQLISGNISVYME